MTLHEDQCLEKTALGPVNGQQCRKINAWTVLHEDQCWTVLHCRKYSMYGQRKALLADKVWNEDNAKTVSTAEDRKTNVWNAGVPIHGYQNKTMH
jgi:hypothetical protein